MTIDDTPSGKESGFGNYENKIVIHVYCERKSNPQGRSRFRYLRELMQNADDALADDSAEAAELIGTKGLVFISVLEVTDRPEIYSRPFSFRFSKSDTETLLQSRLEKRIAAPTFEIPHAAARQAQAGFRDIRGFNRKPTVASKGRSRNRGFISQHRINTSIFNGVDRTPLPPIQMRTPPAADFRARIGGIGAKYGARIVEICDVMPWAGCTVSALPRELKHSNHATSTSRHVVWSLPAPISILDESARRIRHVRKMLRSCRRQLASIGRPQ